MGWITDENPWCPTHFFGTHLTKPRDRGAFLFPKAKKMTNIKFDAHNYRTHDEKNLKLIKKSLKELGAGRSIVIDSEGEIIAGNATYKQARELGLPVQVIETDGKRLIVVKRTDLKTQDKKRKRLALMDNSTSDKVQWDFDHIAADFDLSELPDFGIEALPDMAPVEPVEPVEEDDAPEVSETTPRAKKGDIWQLGDHRLMCGDSTVITDVEKLMGGEKADLLLTDPPYNVAYEGKTEEKLTIKNDKQDDSQFLQFLTDCFSCAFSVLKEGASFYVWHADSEGLNFRLAIKNAGLTLKQNLIWVKNSMVLGRQDYQWRHEPCLYGWKEGAAHNWYSDRKQTTILEFDRPTKSKEHPTMKPIALFAYQLGNSTQRGDLVLDLFGGSGTSIIASEQTGRKCYTMELDENYCNVIITRWERLTGKQARLLEA